MSSFYPLGVLSTALSAAKSAVGYVLEGERVSATTAATNIISGAVTPLSSQAQSLLDRIKGEAGLLLPKTQGLSPVPTESSEAAELKSRLSDVNRWANILVSMERTMLSRMDAPKLVEALRVWRGGMLARSQAFLSEAISREKSLATRIRESDGMVNTREGEAYVTARKSALSESAGAVAYAQKIASSIERDWAKAAQAGKPSVAEYAFAPVTGAVDLGRSAVGAGRDAAAAAKDALKAAGSKLESFGAAVPTTVKWVAIGGVAFAALYAMGLARPLLPNPPRRRYR